MVRMYYHDVRARIGAHVTGNRKKCVRKFQKVQNRNFFLLGGCISPIEFHRGMATSLENLWGMGNGSV